KALYEEIKVEIGEEAAVSHPARFALCEIVNLHDEALSFEPIYRVAFGVDPDRFVSELESYLLSLDGDADPQAIEVIWKDGCREIKIERPIAQLAVGTVQAFLDEFVKAHPDVTVDYIHGVESTKMLAQRDGAVGILFEGMGKDMLFKTVICDGALPRKTFSMGHAADKRFYIECREIR
ncbi:MAG: DUF1015 family protein, partial [Clostridia bacterium]|nr:DUF1015 family protein [Clostridia bacterium]